MTRDPRPYLAIVAVVFIVHGQTLLFDFVYFDDDKLILTDQTFLRDPSNVRQAFQRDVFGRGSIAYRPFLTLSLMPEAWMGGTSALGYHLTNVVLHALATLCVFLFLLTSGYAHGASGLATVIFAVHPLLTSAVAWIPGRNDSLLAVFALSSWIAFTRYARSESWRAYVTHTALFAGALFTKETALALPFVATIYLGLLAREYLVPRRTMVLAAGWLGTAVVWWVFRASALSGTRTIHVTGAALAMSARATLELLGGIVFPLRLPVYPTFSTEATAIGIVALLILAAAAFAVPRERRAYVLFGATWFVALLAPTVGFRKSSAVFDYLDHRVYLPLVGMTIVALEIFHGIRPRISARAGARLALALAVILTGLTAWHARQYRDAMTFWSAAVNDAPRSADARFSFGYVLHTRGDLSGAEAAYRAAIELEPADPIASPKYYVNLGMIYELKGMPREAARKYGDAIALGPNALAHLNLGALRHREGRLHEAEQEYFQAMVLDPRLALAHVNMCAVRAQQQRLDDAERFCRRALELEPDSERALIGLAVVSYSQQRYREASERVDELKARGVPVERIIPAVVEGLKSHRK